jgi:hypothetical protein
VPFFDFRSLASLSSLSLFIRSSASPEFSSPLTPLEKKSRWLPSGRGRAPLLHSSHPSTPIASFLSLVITCLSFLNPIFFILLRLGFLLPKELCSWRICHGVTVPIEDTHESVVYIPFLIRGLAFPISPFFRGLLDFYELNLTHLNPNSILQVAIFVHLCEAFLRILPHFGLWKYLYHYRPGMAGGEHQLVGGASLELRRGRKVEYLDIPLKDSIKG